MKNHKQTLAEIMSKPIPILPIINVTTYNPHWCIFEKRNCKFAKYDGTVSECKAPSDNEMTCIK